MQVVLLTHAAVTLLNWFHGDSLMPIGVSPGTTDAGDEIVTVFDHQK